MEDIIVVQAWDGKQYVIAAVFTSPGDMREKLGFGPDDDSIFKVMRFKPNDTTALMAGWKKHVVSANVFQARQDLIGRKTVSPVSGKEFVIAAVLSSQQTEEMGIVPAVATLILADETKKPTLIPLTKWIQEWK